jgi:two-component sensor histidine kinase
MIHGRDDPGEHACQETKAIMDAETLPATTDTAAIRPTRLARHQEADHRVSNSLQLVIALLSMQAREAADHRVQEALTAAARRIAAISAIHRQLSRSHAEDAVDIAAYLRELGRGLEDGLGSPRGRRRVSVHAQSRLVHPAFATVVGILVSELVMNACKHAYRQDEPGDIDVSLFFAEASRFILEVRDYGKGDGLGEPTGSAGLGTDLIRAMSRGLGATCVYDRSHEGTRVTLRGVVEPRFV